MISYTIYIGNTTVWMVLILGIFSKFPIMPYSSSLPQYFEYSLLNIVALSFNVQF